MPAVCLHASNEKIRPILEKLNDQTTLEAIRRGDQAAFETMFRAHYPALCRYASTLADGDWDEAEDIVQQAFVKIWEQRERIQILWSAKSYLYKVVHNAALNRLRAARTRERFKQYNAEQLETNHAPHPYPEQELRERLQKALAALPAQCRRIFELSRFEELKYREIAEQLDISIKTVEAQMGKALRLLRGQLADFLVSAIWAMAAFFNP